MRPRPATGKISSSSRTSSRSLQRLHLFLKEEPRHSRGAVRPTFKARPQVAQIFEHVRGDWLSLKVPDDGAQFVVLVEHQAVVDSPQPARLIPQAVAALAIGVICQRVEQRHALQVGAMLIAQCEVCLRRIVLHEYLHRPDAIRPLAGNGERHDVPAERPAQLECRALPQVQRPRRKIPQRRLSTLRLVDDS